jgi:predicted  nucleic acid-binding Zn-ribbon protein
MAANMADFEKLADRVVEAARGFIQRAVSPLQENIRAALERLDKHAQALESLERRASRSSQHLAELERKMQSVLRKVGGE